MRGDGGVGLGADGADFGLVAGRGRGEQQGRERGERDYSAASRKKLPLSRIAGKASG
jgi:hypothetical protein